MADMQAPILKETIPDQVANEEGAWGPFDLNTYIASPTPESGAVHFFAELLSGEPLPKGLICNPDGNISGTPAKGTKGFYVITVIAENDSGIPFATEFRFIIEPSIAAIAETEKKEWWPGLKTLVWEALGKNLPAPDLNSLYDRPITAVEIYYLLERFATLTIWDAYNLEAPVDKAILQLKDISPYYNIYDRGSCLIGAPKELFSHERTLEDALQTARVMASEAYKRGWVIQLAGFEKMMRAAWIELQYLGSKHGKPAEVLYYTPTPTDMKIYEARAQMLNRMI